VKQNILALGILRGVSTRAGFGALDNSHPFVVTNPLPSSILYASDRIYTLCTQTPSLELQQIDLADFISNRIPSDSILEGLNQRENEDFYDEILKQLKDLKDKTTNSVKSLQMEAQQRMW